MSFVSVNPSTGEELAVYPCLSPAQADAAAERAASGFARMAALSVPERTALLQRCAQALGAHEDRAAELMAREVGKPLAEGRAEIQKCAWVCRYFAEHAAAHLAPTPLDAGVTRSYAAYEPLGVVLAIMPWNFPFWQVFRFAAPAYAAGNAMLLKGAPNVGGCTELIGQILTEAGFPAGAVEVVHTDTDGTAHLIAHPDVCAVTLTGSTRAGRAVAAQAGAHLKKVVLELGGSDPYLILADADIEAAAEACVTSRLINGGQSCIAAKRLIVVEAVREAFTQAVATRLQAKTYGNPLTGTYDIGPMARPDLRDQLHAQVTASVAAGARLHLGGFVPDGPGCFYPPTLLTHVPPHAPAFCEELFGPVAAIIGAADEEDAVRLANQSSYGLGAAVFSRDTARAEHLARVRLQAGCAFVNGFVRSDPRLPFGGIKDSGYGRELSLAGIREWVNTKTVWVA